MTRSQFLQLCLLNRLALTARGIVSETSFGPTSERPRDPLLLRDIDPSTTLTPLAFDIEALHPHAQVGDVAASRLLTTLRRACRTASPSVAFKKAEPEAANRIRIGFSVCANFPGAWCKKKVPRLGTTPAKKQLGMAAGSAVLPGFPFHVTAAAKLSVMTARARSSQGTGTKVRTPSKGKQPDRKRGPDRSSRKERRG